MGSTNVSVGCPYYDIKETYCTAQLLFTSYVETVGKRMIPCWVSFLGESRLHATALCSYWSEIDLFKNRMSECLQRTPLPLSTDF